VRGVAAKYLFEYKIGRRKPKQQWMGVGWAKKLFGTDVVREQVGAFRATVRHVSMLAGQVEEQVAESGTSSLAPVCMYVHLLTVQYRKSMSTRVRGLGIYKRTKS
jgi:hypothetical protein